MEEYSNEIEVGKVTIEEYKRRLARNDTIAHRVFQKKKTGNVKLPKEEVVVFSASRSFEVNQLNLDDIFRVELDLEESTFYDGLSVPQRWNSLLFGY